MVISKWRRRLSRILKGDDGRKEHPGTPREVGTSVLSERMDAEAGTSEVIAEDEGPERVENLTHVLPKSGKATVGTSEVITVGEYGELVKGTTHTGDARTTCARCSTALRVQKSPESQSEQ